MIRVATVPLQRTAVAGMQRAQAALADTLRQLDTGKIAKDYAGLGSGTVRALSSRTLVAAQDAQKASATRLGTTLSLYDVNIAQIDTVATDLRKTILTAIGTGQTGGLQEAIESAFGQVAGALNATDGSDPLFAGAQPDAPFAIRKLADVAGFTDAEAFTNDNIRASARIADGIDLSYGVTARELGSGLLTAFRTLTGAGTIGDTPTDAQKDALNAAITQIDAALPGVRALHAENGRLQASVETMVTRAEDRKLLLEASISRVEDADSAQLAVDLDRQRGILNASFSVYTRISELTLLNYMR